MFTGCARIASAMTIEHLLAIFMKFYATRPPRRDRQGWHRKILNRRGELASHEVCGRGYDGRLAIKMESPPKVGEMQHRIRAARALLRWEQRDLAGASSVSLPTIKRLESRPGIMAAHMSTVAALRKTLEAAGVEFIDENGRGPGVRLRKRLQKRR